MITQSEKLPSQIVTSSTYRWRSTRQAEFTFKREGLVFCFHLVPQSLFLYFFRSEIIADCEWVFGGFSLCGYQHVLGQSIGSGSVVTDFKWRHLTTMYVMLFLVFLHRSVELRNEVTKITFGSSWSFRQDWRLILSSLFLSHSIHRRGYRAASS